MLATAFARSLGAHGTTHKLPYWLALVETEALLQAGQTVDPDRERQEPDISGENSQQSPSSYRGISPQNGSGVVERLF